MNDVMYTYNFGLIPLVEDVPDRECYTRYHGLCDCKDKDGMNGLIDVYELDDGSYIAVLGEEGVIYDVQ